MIKAAFAVAFAGWLVSGCAVQSWTAQAEPTKKPAAVSTTKPVSTIEITASIVVLEPPDGATVRSPLQVSGTASVFEAAVSIRIRDAAGKIVAEGHTTATRGAPDRGSFTVSVPFNAAGPATVEVFSASPKDGSDQFLVRRPVTLVR